MKKVIKVGNKYSAPKGNLFESELIVITKVVEPLNPDGHSYFDTKKKYHRRIHQKVRNWWIDEFCRVVK